MSERVIVVGGGLAGLSTAHTILEQGGRVIILDKSAYLGGNSTKATSGINGALTQTQVQNGIKDDSREIFYEDAAKSAAAGCRPELVKVLTYGSAPAVEWLQDNFGVDLSKVAMMGGHSMPRCHRGKERFPGAAITMQLMEAFDQVCDEQPERAILKCKARVTKLLTAVEGDASSGVIGVEWTDKEGAVHSEYGPVVLCSGGFGADFSDSSLLAEVEPEWNQLKAFGDVPSAAGRLRTLPTTNGQHCTGDGVKMARALGAGTVDLEAVQVHPTGLIHPDDPKGKVRFLAAEALRGVGGILLDKNGERFVDELGKRDYVTGRMWNNGVANGVAPGDEAFALVLNSASSKEIEWHCKHYSSRGLMKQYASGAELAAGLGVPVATLARVFKEYNEAARTGSDVYGKKFFKHAPFEMSDSFHVGMIGPVVHYTMGGVEANDKSEVLHGATKRVIPGVFAAGEVMGGVHGKNRLGGNSLLDCVVYGRVAGRRAAKYLLEQHLAAPNRGVAAGAAAASGGGAVTGAGAPPSTMLSSHTAVVGGATTLYLTQGGIHTAITIAPGQTLSLSFTGGDPTASSVSVAAASAAANDRRPTSSKPNAKRVDFATPEADTPMHAVCGALAACLVPPSDLRRQ